MLKGRRIEQIVLLIAATATLKFHSYFTLGAMFVKIDVILDTAMCNNVCAEGNVTYHASRRQNFLRVPTRRRAD
jgi:hypothetical protein